MLTAEELKSQLNQFTGSDQYHDHFLKFKYTDGIKFLADQAECHWLLDIVGSYQPKLSKHPMLRDFQIWLLVVGDSHEFIKPKAGNDAVVTCWEDTPKLGVKPAISQQILCTNFPLPQIQLYFENGILLLPSER